MIAADIKYHMCQLGMNRCDADMNVQVILGKCEKSNLYKNV